MCSPRVRVSLSIFRRRRSASDGSSDSGDMNAVGAVSVEGVVGMTSTVDEWGWEDEACRKLSSLYL